MTTQHDNEIAKALSSIMARYASGEEIPAMAKEIHVSASRVYRCLARTLTTQQYQALKETHYRTHVDEAAQRLALAANDTIERKLATTMYKRALWNFHRRCPWLSHGTGNRPPHLAAGGVP